MANDRMPHPANPRIILTANTHDMRQHIKYTLAYTQT